jgi:adenylate cyclase
MYGELIPLGGGDPIPLLKQKVLIGRREKCDIVLRFPNVSAHHCEMYLSNGYWYIVDLNSRNGVKVNNIRVEAGEKRIDPGDSVSIARHKFELRYSPAALGAVGPPPKEDEIGQVMGRSLLERAGLKKPRRGFGAMPDEEDTR